MTEWTQEQAIAFECARETITDLMAILTEQMAGAGTPPDADVDALKQQRARLAAERDQLRAGDVAKVARINAEYGEVVRAWRRRANTSHSNG